jgi:hypothetical protein
MHFKQLFLTLSILVLPLCAETRYGVVKKVSGVVSITNSNGTTTIGKGSCVYNTELLQTSKKSHVEIELFSGNTLKLGPEQKIKLFSSKLEIPKQFYPYQHGKYTIRRPSQVDGVR